MVHRSGVDGGPAGLRAALGELLVGLRQAAVDGVVPEGAFDKGVRALALGDAERERLRHELARLGLPVRDLHVHAGNDLRNGEKVVQGYGENVSLRLDLVRTLLNRYADADGYVTARVLEGVTRLAGLTVREAAQLRAEALVLVEGEAEEPESETAPEPEPHEGVESEGADESRCDLADEPHGDLGRALAAAHAVLDTDRHERRPEKRLLSAQAEVGLSVLVRGGAEHVGREPEEDELKELPPDDLRIRARDCLVLHNLRLVHSLVRAYLDQGLDYGDLLQHGCLGLLRAVRKFDPTKGFKFSTYATWWVRQSITRAIADEGALIRIPVHMHEQMRKVARAERMLEAEGLRATVADVAVRCDMTLRKVEEVRRLSRRTDSLDRVIGDGATLADFVGETHALPSVEKQVLDALQVEEALAVVDTFGERERRILVRRLGLDGDEPSTLEELGREFGVTRERIRQIESKARPELRSRLRAVGLVDVDLDALCEEAERAAEKAADAVRRARIARATHAARTARARRALRRTREERLAAAATDHEQIPETTLPVAEAGENQEAPVSEAQAWADPIAGEVTAVEGDTAAGDAAVAGRGTTAGEGTTVDSDAAPEAAASEAATVGQATDAETIADTGTEDGAGRESGTVDNTETKTRREEDRQPVPGMDGHPEPEPRDGAEPRTGTVPSAASLPAADWDRARRMAKAPVEQDGWLAEYVLAALGYQGLVALLGPQAADVVRDAPAGAYLSRDVLTALEVLRRVLDHLVGAGQRPEDFLDRPARCLNSGTPRAYLTARPLVHRESRLAVRDALREYIAASAASTVSVDDVRSEYETREARLRAEFEQRLADQRRSAEQELAAWEEILLTRMDTMVLRREGRIRAEAVRRIAQLKAQHHEAYQEVLRRAEAAEEALRRAENHQDRTDALELQLRRYREGAAARIADLEAQLWQARAALTQRDQADEDILRRQREAAEARLAALEAQLRETEDALARQEQAVTAARHHAEHTEQQAAQRIAQTEHDAWVQITELRQQLAQTQEQLAAAEAAAGNRSSFRDRWRRS